MTLLGIETSCDETSAAVVRNGRAVLSNVIASQIDVHQTYGGVVPEIAARKHTECISYIVQSALEQAGLPLSAMDAVCVANGPGLAGALLVGLSFGKALAFAQRVPLLGVHHIHAHICANFLDSDVKPPFICLVVSGGHTHLVRVPDYLSCQVLGRTRDDAAGEAFDKVGRALGLPYPGGPQIDRLAREGNPAAVRFPRAIVEGDFSFSGLKSAVLQFVQKQQAGAHPDLTLADIAASFQQAVIDVLVSHTLEACAQSGLKEVALAGGVAANAGLRTAMEAACTEKGYRLHMPSPVFCTDNAAMVAGAGYYRLLAGQADAYDLNAHPSMELEE